MFESGVADTSSVEKAKNKKFDQLMMFGWWCKF
ncbi:Uncharacterised protein [Moraxella caviae]|uniref:Uncharacterized protein n=1 Tax=Moraxella caviae TaxID=34060 RepID=A0A378R5K3_9GAMM|nr:Uncharacterised protein [Moraxella caviae]VEW13220.1 Uncharacterised protein [Moraxella caviae]